MRKIRRMKLQQKDKDSLWILIQHQGQNLHFSGLDHNFALSQTLCTIRLPFLKICE
jgi:hypothetical protein